MGDVPGILERLTQRPDVATLAQLIAALEHERDETLAAFNQIMATKDRERILEACAQHPMLALPLLEGWLTIASEFETPRLQRSLAHKLVERSKLEASRLRHASDLLGPEIAAELVDVQQLHASRTAYAEQVTRLAELRSEKAKLQGEVAEFDQLNSDITQLRARNKKKKDTDIVRLRENLSELRAEYEALARQEADLDDQAATLDEKLNKLKIRIGSNVATHKQAMIERLQHLEPQTNVYGTYIALVEQNNRDGRYTTLVAMMKELDLFFNHQELERRINTVSEEIHKFNEMTT